MLFLFIGLKVPLLALCYLTKRRPHPARPLPRTPRRGPHGEPALPAPPRVRPVTARARELER